MFKANRGLLFFICTMIFSPSVIAMKRSWAQEKIQLTKIQSNSKKHPLYKPHSGRGSRPHSARHI